MQTIAVLMALLSCWPGFAEAAGYLTLRSLGQVVGVWYPSDYAEKSGQMAPVTARLAFDGGLRRGRYPPILLSHDRNGQLQDISETARVLANNGFVVIAPLHSVDQRVVGEKMAVALYWRTRELAQALELVMRQPRFADALDLSNIHGLGFGLGAVSVMAAAGAAIEVKQARKYCASEQDPAFCLGMGFFARWKMRRLRGIEEPALDQFIPDTYRVLPFINGNLALVAPVGQGISVNKNLFMGQNVLVIGFKGDQITPPERHASVLAQLIPPKKLTGYVLRPAQHLAFRSPSGAQQTASNSPRFSQDVFLSNLNAELVHHFNR